MLAELVTGTSLVLEPAVAARAAEQLEAFRQVGREASAATGLPAAMCTAFLQGVARVESVFDPWAMNPGTRAAGLMQVMPVHFASLGWVSGSYAGDRRGTGGAGWFDPVQNLRAGVRILQGFGWRKGGNSVGYILQHYAGHSSFDQDAADYVATVTRWATFFRFWRPT